MSTATPQQPGYILAITGEERERILALLRQELADSRVEAHRTHTPACRDVVIGHESAIRALIEKLERLRPASGAAAPRIASAIGTEDAPSATDALYIDEQGRFQMPTDDLEDFVQFLRDNEVRVEIETAVAFHSGGHDYGYGRLVHLFDTDAVTNFYRMWTRAHAGQTAVATA